uniref:Uncharacterized protein n=1 Tax=Tetranychus urticae TaxID=32264 RepID=T1L4E5_TETUR
MILATSMQVDQVKARCWIPLLYNTTHTKLI